MPGTPHSFKRLVLGLQPSAPDRGLQVAVELADLLHLDLLGLLLEDPSLRHLAAMPFARELRALGGGWQPIDLERLSRDVELAARNIERMFRDEAKRLATKHEFEIARGPTIETVASITRTDDIVMIVEPISAAERATQQFAWLIEAALRSAAAVMFVPRRVARTRGPVAAVAATADDPSIRAAAAIAMAAKEDLVVIDVCETAIDEARIRALADEFHVKIKHVVAGKASWSHLPALQQVQERLLVVTRGAVAAAVAPAIASERRVPVLVVEPPEALTPGAEPARPDEITATESPPPRSAR